MKIRKLHEWQLNIADAIDLQRRLATQVSRSYEVIVPRYIAGVDISAGRAKKTATGAVVVLSYPGYELEEVEIVQGRLEFPYVPGLLSFRELPLTIAALERLHVTPDLIMVDGQGVAHPRRFGLASHLGLLLDIPTIGCAKSRLCGNHEEPGIERGRYADLVDKDEKIGVVLRTRPGVKPVYVSIGHRVDLQTARYWVLESCRGYRLPEPTRLAHLAAGGNLKTKQEIGVFTTVS